ncbi:hypothetical protein FSD31_24165, partial [Salmonella enterica]|nr:hypothetical protein [Salmonella enterica]
KWMRAGTRRNVGTRHAKRRCALQSGSLTAGVRKAQETARKKGGVTGTVAASLLLTLRQWDGNPLPRRGRAGTAQLARCAA